MLRGAGSRADVLFLVDAKVLIRAHEDYYPIERVPQFWQWLEQEARANRVKMPLEMFSEIADSKGPLRDWICEPEVKKALVLDEEVDQDSLDEVLTEGYGDKLTEVDLEKIGSDAFLIAYALAERDRVVVTKETSRPKKLGGNRKIPDVCNTLNVGCIGDFELYRRLRFSTA